MNLFFTKIRVILPLTMGPLVRPKGFTRGSERLVSLPENGLFAVCWWRTPFGTVECHNSSGGDEDPFGSGTDRGTRRHNERTVTEQQLLLY